MLSKVKSKIRLKICGDSGKHISRYKKRIFINHCRFEQIQKLSSMCHLKADKYETLQQVMVSQYKNSSLST